MEKPIQMTQNQQPGDLEKRLREIKEVVDRTNKEEIKRKLQELQQELNEFNYESFKKKFEILEKRLNELGLYEKEDEDSKNNHYESALNKLRIGDNENAERLFKKIPQSDPDYQKTQDYLTIISLNKKAKEYDSNENYGKSAICKFEIIARHIKNKDAGLDYTASIKKELEEYAKEKGFYKPLKKPFLILSNGIKKFLGDFQ